MNDGLHSMHYRFKDTDHRWSSVLSRYIVCKSGTQVFAGNRIVACRYWFNGESMTEVALDDPVQNLAFMDTLEMYRYRKGEYYVTLQFKDELGLWSAPLTDTLEKIGFPVARVFSPGEIVCDTATLEFLSQSYDADSRLWSVNGLPVSGDTVLYYFFSETGVYDVGLTAREKAYRSVPYRVTPIYGAQMRPPGVSWPARSSGIS
ncbi:MAG: hypothetical protein P1P86_01550 [Bacteroidales bacterium]|nr:hypothetical protein [Bacteroidales bacterium]